MTPHPDTALPAPVPSSDRVRPTLILGGDKAFTFAGLGPLADAAREIVGARRHDLKPVTLAYPTVQGPGFNLYAVGPAGREWIGAVAGVGVNQIDLDALLTPRGRRAAA